MPQYPVAPRETLLAVAQDLIIKGWQPVWCLQRQNGGFTPMNGLIGNTTDAPFPTVVPQPQGAHRLGFRPPHEAFAFDVDHYDIKRGADTMDKAEEWLGDLPPTYKVTSRGPDDPGGRFLFGKPADLQFTASALSQFGDDNGKTWVDLVRTTERHSWAPGDINHKNGLVVKCFDPDGEPCLMPHVHELPMLPDRWIEYLRNPPMQYSLSSYQRLGDGPQWWLLHQDDSIGGDDELKDFAWDLMRSRLPIDEAFEQWLRVSKNDDPTWPWGRDDFDRHTRAQAQNKVAEILAKEDAERAALPASEEQLDRIEQQTREAYERDQKLIALRDQRIFETISQQNLFPAVPLEEDAAPKPQQSWAQFVKEMVRGTPVYDQRFKHKLADKIADEDAAYFLATQFTGYRDISQLEEPPGPETLCVTGLDNATTRVIAPATITVMSGHRSSGKTWATAVWAAQEIRAGNRVIWLDFERQDRLLASKFRQLGIGPHLMSGQLQYTSVLPPVQQLVHDVTEATEHGAHRCLVVVDAWRTLQNLVKPGSNANDGDAVEQVYIDYLTPLQEAGANVVLLDHKAKTGLGGTFGSERKESAADYVIDVEQAKPFSKRTQGFSSLTLTKVRGGHDDIGTPFGYLWMPGDGSGTADTGITKYPPVPELRSWAPEGPAITLADTAGMSEQGEKELAITDAVRANRLRFGRATLADHVLDVHPGLFKSKGACESFQDRMWKAGQLTKEEGRGGKYDVPDVVVEVQQTPPMIDPAQLQHQEE